MSQALKQTTKKRGSYKKLSFRGELPTGPVGNPNIKPIYTEDQIVVEEDKMLKVMASGLSFESIAAELGISVRTLYVYAAKYPELAAIKEKGEALSLKHWETILVNGAMGNLKGFNAIATIFAMKNKFSSLYKDKQEIETTNYNVYEVKGIDQKKYIEALKRDKFLASSDHIEIEHTNNEPTKHVNELEEDEGKCLNEGLTTLHTELSPHKKEEKS